MAKRKKQAEPPRRMTLTDAAHEVERLLSVPISRATIRDWFNEGLVRGVRVGVQRRIMVEIDMVLAVVRDGRDAVNG